MLISKTFKKITNTKLLIICPHEYTNEKNRFKFIFYLSFVLPLHLHSKSLIFSYPIKNKWKSSFILSNYHKSEHRSEFSFIISGKTAHVN